MTNVAVGCLGFLVLHLFDVLSLKRIRWGAKPLAWTLGISLVAYSLIMVCLAPDKLSLPVWSMWLGWALLPASLSMLMVSLFLNLPFRKTYVTAGIGDKLVTDGLYALVRHPGVIWFVPFVFSLLLISRSSRLLIGAPVFILLDIVLVAVQDRFFLSKMFAGYEGYRHKTPMLVPNRQSLNAFIGSVRRQFTA